jgi:hypothetical protein
MIIKIPDQILNLFYLLHNFTEYFASSSSDTSHYQCSTYVHQVAFFTNFPIELCVPSLLPAKYASPVCYMHWIVKNPKYLFFLQSKK